jgi:ethanolamine permease
LGRTLPERKTPAAALILNTAIGILALLSGRTSEIITISVFGALTLYVVSMLAFFRLRKKEPARARPFRTPFYPIVPGIALVLALLCLMALAYYNPRLALIYLGIVVGGFTWFYIVVPKTVRDQSVLEVAL